jgi:hypothetical protein
MKINGEQHGMDAGHAADPGGAQDYAAPDPETLGDSSFSELVGRLRHEFPDALSVPLCEEILDWLKDEGELSNAGQNRRSFSKAERQVLFIKTLEYIWRHPALTDIYAALYVWDEPLLDDIIGHYNPAEFAAKLGLSREATNNPVLRAQKYFKLPPRRGQRTKNARTNMSQARVKQLHAKT